MIGQLLDRRYRILRVLGAGGFGETYVAEDTRIPGNPTCVVKHLKPASNSPNVLQMARQLFDREAKTLAEVGNHQQIPRLLAYFEENQEFYLVQEFIDGHTLGTELPPGKRWSESEVIQMLQEILSILEFVHKHGVIHRDIKPDNIIRRTSDNSLFLIDFGAIKELQNQQISAAAQGSAGATGTRIGTPGYMPTEQARGKPRPNSDIYALGMVGIQALTGTYPHLLEENNEGEIIWQHQAQVRQELEAVLTKMVLYHFKDRYQTATEALQAVQKLANPPYQATAPVTNATTAVQELTLEWMEAGLLKTQTISESQPSKTPGTVRIGRDTQTCDIVLSEPTVSRLHVEIFFNPQEQSFYLRNLSDNNPAVVNGQPLRGEVALRKGYTLRLGQLDLRVSAIALQQYPAGYTPTKYVTQQESTPQPPAARTVQPPVTPPDTPPPQPSPPPNPSPNPPSHDKLRQPLILGVGITAVLSSLALIGWAINHNSASNSTSVVSSSSPSLSPASCYAVVGLGGNAKIRSKPDAYRGDDNVVESVSGSQLAVTGKQTEGGWREVKRSNGELAWAHQKVISNDEEMNSCLKTKGITVQTVDDIAPPPRPSPDKSDTSDNSNQESTAPNKGDNQNNTDNAPEHQSQQQETPAPEQQSQQQETPAPEQQSQQQETPAPEQQSQQQ